MPFVLIISACHLIIVPLCYILLIISACHSSLSICASITSMRYGLDPRHSARFGVPVRWQSEQNSGERKSSVVWALIACIDVCVCVYRTIFHPGINV